MRYEPGGSAAVFEFSSKQKMMQNSRRLIRSRRLLGITLGLVIYIFYRCFYKVLNHSLKNIATISLIESQHHYGFHCSIHCVCKMFHFFHNSEMSHILAFLKGRWKNTNLYSSQILWCNFLNFFCNRCDWYDKKIWLVLQNFSGSNRFSLAISKDTCALFFFQFCKNDKGKKPINNEQTLFVFKRAFYPSSRRLLQFHPAFDFWNF